MYWCLIKDYQDSEEFIKWGINLKELDIDFTKNNLVFSYYREIKIMKFKRAYWFPYHKISVVTTIMSKIFKPETIYIYKIPKYNISVDMQARTSTFIEK